MANTRDIKHKINSIKNIQKITSTMEKVATARIKKTQDRLMRSREYYFELVDMTRLLFNEMNMRGQSLSDGDPESSIYFPKVLPTGSELVIVITSNRGLCGGFNNNVIHMARILLSQIENNNKKADLLVIGKKGINYFKFVGREMFKTYSTIDEKMSFTEIAEISTDIMGYYQKGQYDKVHMIFTHYISPSRQSPIEQLYFPIDPTVNPPGKEEKPVEKGYKTVLTTAIEPIQLFKELGYRVSQMKLFHALLESQSSEQIARKAAMKQATDSAGDMIVDLTKAYNRARQSKITTELTEIVGAAKAME